MTGKQKDEYLEGCPQRFRSGRTVQLKTDAIISHMAYMDLTAAERKKLDEAHSTPLLPSLCRTSRHMAAFPLSLPFSQAHATPLDEEHLAAVAADLAEHVDKVREQRMAMVNMGRRDRSGSLDSDDRESEVDDGSDFEPDEDDESTEESESELPDDEQDLPNEQDLPGEAQQASTPQAASAPVPQGEAQQAGTPKAASAAVPAADADRPLAEVMKALLEMQWESAQLQTKSCLVPPELQERMHRASAAIDQAKQFDKKPLLEAGQVLLDCRVSVAVHKGHLLERVGPKPSEGAPAVVLGIWEKGKASAMATLDQAEEKMRGKQAEWEELLKGAGDVRVPFDEGPPSTGQSGDSQSLLVPVAEALASWHQAEWEAAQLQMKGGSIPPELDERRKRVYTALDQAQGVERKPLLEAARAEIDSRLAVTCHEAALQQVEPQPPEGTHPVALTVWKDKKAAAEGNVATARKELLAKQGAWEALLKGTGNVLVPYDKVTPPKPPQPKAGKKEPEPKKEKGKREHGGKKERERKRPRSGNPGTEPGTHEKKHWTDFDHTKHTFGDDRDVYFTGDDTWCALQACAPSSIRPLMPELPTENTASSPAAARHRGLRAEVPCSRPGSCAVASRRKVGAAMSGSCRPPRPQHPIS